MNKGRPTIPEAERRRNPGLSVHPDNIALLAKLAALESKRQGKRITPSSILDGILTDIRMNQENGHGKNDQREPDRTSRSNRASRSATMAA